ncbi:hypothetical protein V6N13_005871 [Hibiscus sabdariffa]|uniref:Leucine-rich repeat-containing N-terminal plant-type domain-containing protein n=1 Tax=Hibiscus sabdariffa TaxID=183260 RepID=A0ABR2EPH0_9ROSI
MRISLVSWFIFSLYIATFFSISALSVSGQCQSHQQQLLLGFKNSLNSSLSEKLAKWNQGTDCCSWDGITCDTSGRVIGLHLSSESISGEINNSNSLFRLQHLQELSLADNKQLGGQLPESIVNLGQLTSGTVPPALFQSESLKAMHLAENQFSGGFGEVKGELSSRLQFPMFVFEIQGLEILSLSWNKFSGVIALSAFQKLQNLTTLDLSYNNLSVDSSFTNLPLPLLPPFPNNLSGSIPQCLMTLMRESLVVLNLKQNNLSGIISDTFAENCTLQTHYLHQNRLGGKVPKSLANCRMLEVLELGNNYIDDTFPCHLNNHLAGQIPLQLADLNFLSFLNLSNNELTGRIPLGTQIQSFSEASFGNNAGLCGRPLEVVMILLLK